MKPYLTAILTASLLAGCAGGTYGVADGGQTGSISNNLIKMYVDNQCRTELQSRNEWRLVSLAMSQEQQTEWENRICGCASEEAPKQITAADMPQLLTEQGRTRVLADVTVKTVTACVQRLYPGNR